MKLYKPDKLPLAQAYIPNQLYQEILPLDVAFREGTLFKELVRPYPCDKRS